MKNNIKIKPFKNCPALDGYHCQTNSLAKIFYHFGHPLSEDMLLGLGAGMGFIYWKMKIGNQNTVFIGGRGNNKNFFEDIGKRTGVKINLLTTSSEKKAQASLMETLALKQPSMLFGDMGFLPWFDMPEDYHFGGHTFTVCGYDQKNTVLASDMDQKSSGLKKGFYYPISLEQLQKARNSPFKPFSPKNTYLKFDFKGFHNPRPEDIYSSMKQTVESQLNPPIKNLGVKGIRHTAKELPKWSKIFEDKELRLNLFTLYIYIEIGGTGGGCFRYMYSRFLKEAVEVTDNSALTEAAMIFDETGRKFTEIGLLFKDAETIDSIDEKIRVASQKFHEIADLEEKTYLALKNQIS